MGFSPLPFGAIALQLFYVQCAKRCFPYLRFQLGTPFLYATMRLHTFSYGIRDRQTSTAGRANSSLALV
jgi:hypothetical protein